ncbi:hypothetical protein [Acetobacter vaccinii]|uniref:Tail fiber protein n=1 Tax=Acetobacter vaccinii TaxID=2592655 RepID=A0A5C1YSE0_9PROT|nr:hypothetical protein [Acetobacter vaccinii]QEO17867.1 hypothetical protein FLP30_09080 [Acetobacter vaccinii]
MKSDNDRKLFGTLIAENAASGDVEAIPASQSASGDGRASIALGFPPETFVARAAGGIPPYGSDMNGLLNVLSGAIQILQAGFLGPFNATFAQSIGGYPAGAIVSGAIAGTFWVSMTDANVSVPGADGATWQSLFNGLAPLSGAAFAGPVTVPTPQDVPGQNTGNNVADTYWVDEWFAPRAALAQYVGGTGAGGNYPISNVQLKNAPAGDTTVAYLQAQTTWGNILFPSQYNVATQISSYAQPKGDYALTQWVKDNYAATEYVQQNYALKTDLPSGGLIDRGTWTQVGSVLRQSFYASVSNGGTVSFPRSFSSASNITVQATVAGNSDADHYVSNVTATGFTIGIFGQGQNAVEFYFSAEGAA